MDVLRIEELMVDCVVGVYPHERNASQPLRVDVEMRLQTETSAIRESLRSTIDYAATASQLVFCFEAADSGSSKPLRMCSHGTFSRRPRPTRDGLRSTPPSFD